LTTGLSIALTVVIVVLAIIVIVRVTLARAIVMEYQAGLLYRNGKFRRRLGPGRYWLFRPRDVITRVDVRPQLVNVTGQEVATSDGVSLKLSLACRYSVENPERAINHVADYQQALYQVLQLALREAVSGSTADALLSARKEWGERLLALTAGPAEEFGLKLQAVNLKDITFPGELKKIFAQVVQAQKEGQAALERARGESAALRNLANAANLVKDNPALMQLRLLQQLGTSSGNTILLGIPATSSPIPIERKGGQQREAEPPSLPPAGE
jgi:regulator of protease activity HflC (stomatin/prohibitin superfamily)